MKMKPEIEKIAAAAADLHRSGCNRGKAAKKRLWRLIYDIVLATLFANEELTRRRTTPALSVN